MLRRVGLLALCACRFHFDDVAQGDGGGSGGDGAIAACSPAEQSVPGSGVIGGLLGTSGIDNAGSCGGAGVAELMYAIDVPASTQLFVAADGPQSSTNNLVYVRSDCDDSATELVCDSTSGIGDFAAYRFGALPAGRYYVFIDGDAGATGPVDGKIQLLLPDGAECSGDGTRHRCRADSYCDATMQRCVPSGCAEVETFTTTGTFNRMITTTPGTSSLHGVDDGISCTPGNDGAVRAPEVVFRAQLATGVSSIRVSTASTMTDFDTVVYARAGCTGQQVACDDDGGQAIEALTSDATTGPLPAGDYYIFIDGFSYSTGNAAVTITIAP